MSIKEKVEVLLTQVAEIKGFSSFELLMDENVIKGDGFLGEFYTGSVKDKDTGKTVETYIKFPTPGNVEMQDMVYKNEYLFYSTLYPALRNFQKEKRVKFPFNNVPIFYCGSKNGLVLENLKIKNFELYDKTKYLNEDHLKTLFEVYGKFHALTFSYKDQNRERYDEMISPVSDVFDFIGAHTESTMESLFKLCYECVKEVDEEKAVKIRPLFENVRFALDQGTVYNGNYSALTHGDCWSNNIMFSYKENGDIADIKLLDYQLLRDSTPVHDLSYFFYSGASKEDFDKLDDYLQLYYKSFCEFAKQLGSDPGKLLPYEALKSDWKNYGFFGIKMSLTIWQIKLMSREQIAHAETDSKEKFMEMMVSVRKSKDFRNKIRDIMLHAIDINII